MNRALARDLVIVASAYANPSAPDLSDAEVEAIIDATTAEQPSWWARVWGFLRRLDTDQPA